MMTDSAMNWMMGGVGLVWILLVVVLLLAIAALIKYLFFGSRRRER